MAELSHSTHLQSLLDQLKAGQDQARELLIQNSVDRFRHLTRDMFPRTSKLHRLDETDDIVQKAMIRLYKALAQIHPPDVKAYVGLASRQIRWALYDLAKSAASRPTIEYVSETPEQEGYAGGPSDSIEWAEFHSAVDQLPDEAREIFDLLFYEGMTQPEAADVLGMPLRTLKRRWRDARLLLGQALHGEWPSLEE